VNNRLDQTIYSKSYFASILLILSDIIYIQIVNNYLRLWLFFADKVDYSHGEGGNIPSKIKLSQSSVTKLGSFGCYTTFDQSQLKCFYN